jgi:hypothetical protein
LLDSFIVDELRLMVAVQAGYARRKINQSLMNKNLDFSCYGLTSYPIAGQE